MQNFYSSGLPAGPASTGNGRHERGRYSPGWPVASMIAPYLSVQGGAGT